MAKSYEPRMHSAEHMLNQTMIRMFGCDRCFSAHINKKKSKCDYRFDKQLTDQEITDIEARTNEQITRNLLVTEEFMPKQEAEKLVTLAKLPDDSIESIRIVRIGDYDICPCIGEHVSNTSEIGAFRIVSHSTTDGVLRIRYTLSAPAE